MLYLTNGNAAAGVGAKTTRERGARKRRRRSLGLAVRFRGAAAEMVIVLYRALGQPANQRQLQTETVQC